MGPQQPYYSWYGGKQRIAQWVVDHIPKHIVYVEPFFGGGAVFSRKGRPLHTNNDYYKEVINDTNSDIFNFFTVLKNREKTRELLRMIKFSLYSREMFNEAKDRNQQRDTERAYRFFVSIGQSFSHIMDGGWGLGPVGANLPAVYLHKIKTILATVRRVQGCYVEKTDALECIDRWDTPQTFFYCDPPYVDTSQGHYEGYKRDKFEKLIDKLKEIKGSFILSSYENDLPFEKFTKRAYCSSSGKGKANFKNKARKPTQQELGDRERTEYLYRKFSERPRPEVVEIYKMPAMRKFVAHPWELKDKMAEMSRKRR